MRVAEQLAHDQPPAGPQHARELAQRRVLIGDLAEHRHEEGRVEACRPDTGAAGVADASAAMFVTPRPFACAHHVVEHLLLDVEDVELSLPASRGATSSE